MNWLSSDVELRQELSEAIKLPEFNQLGKDGVTISRNDLRHYVTDVLAIINEGSNLPRIGSSHEEAIVQLFGRPALTVINNSFTAPISEIWRQRLANAKTNIERVLPAVGRVELRNHQSFDWVGTAWLIDNEVVVTNRHVAEVFGASSGGGFSFRRNYRGREFKSHIDFREEHLMPDEAEFNVEEILYIEDKSGPDLAFMRVSRQNLDGDTLARPVSLSSSDPIPNEDIALVGFPARDSRSTDPDALKRIFGDVYDVKRLSPGKVMEVQEDYFKHDCTSLGGSSGGLVFRLESGEAVGLHFGGKHKTYNVAVPVSIVNDRFSKL